MPCPPQETNTIHTIWGMESMCKETSQCGLAELGRQAQVPGPDHRGVQHAHVHLPSTQRLTQAHLNRGLCVEELVASHIEGFVEGLCGWGLVGGGVYTRKKRVKIPKVIQTPPQKYIGTTLTNNHHLPLPSMQSRISRCYWSF